MALLILIRHGKSEWNKLGLWTGHTDVDLAEEGLEEARRAGTLLKGTIIHHVHVSPLKRTHQTFQEISQQLEGPVAEPQIHTALMERSYGIHTGKDKWAVKKEIGDEAFLTMRRAWDAHIPEGETLKNVHDRVVPYYKEHVLPKLMAGENVLLVGHGNTFRALVKHLENINEKDIEEVEIGTGELHCYEIDSQGNVASKEIRGANEHKLHV